MYDAIRLYSKKLGEDALVYMPSEGKQLTPKYFTQCCNALTLKLSREDIHHEEDDFIKAPV
jgi:hypothetical protein